jgi:hypothetical protein
MVVEVGRMAAVWAVRVVGLEILDLVFGPLFFYTRKTGGHGVMVVALAQAKQVLVGQDQSQVNQIRETPSVCLAVEDRSYWRAWAIFLV